MQGSQWIAVLGTALYSTIATVSFFNSFFSFSPEILTGCVVDPALHCLLPVASFALLHRAALFNCTVKHNKHIVLTHCVDTNLALTTRPRFSFITEHLIHLCHSHNDIPPICCVKPAMKIRHVGLFIAYHFTIEGRSEISMHSTKRK